MKQFKINTKKIKISDMGLEKYGRDLEKKTMAYLKSNHNDMLVNPPTVIDVRRENLAFDYAKADGNHTVTHLENLDYEVVDCRIIPYQPYQVRARIFRELNDGRKQLTVQDKFKARLEEREPSAIEIYKTCKRLGLGFNKIDKNFKRIKAFVSVAWIEQLYKWNVLSEVLETCVSAWGHQTQKNIAQNNMWVVTDYIAKSMGYLIKEYGENIDLDILTKELSKDDPRDVHLRVYEWRGKKDNGFFEIAQIYNQGFYGRDKRKLRVVRR